MNSNATARLKQRFHIAMQCAFAFALALACGSALTAQTDISNTPLSSIGSAVLPNVMFVLDDSSSMSWDHLPDYVDDNNTCRNDSFSINYCWYGDPPYYAAQFNGVYYNPAVTYDPPLRADGTSMPSQTDPTKVVSDPFAGGLDPFTGTATVDVTRYIYEAVYCSSNSDNPWNAGDYPSKCRRNGYDTSNNLITAGFIYNVVTSSTGTAPTLAYPYKSGGTSYDVWNLIWSPAHYYTIAPREHCTSRNLTSCSATTTPTASNPYPALVRFCSTLAAANDVAGGGQANTRCQAKYNASAGYIYARYGTFKRTNIVPAVTSYPKAATRTDCAGATSCAYQEEITNYGNWYAYYRTRMKAMKTAAGQAFAPIDSRYRVGFVTINPGSPVAPNKYLELKPFDFAHKSTWYSKLYAQVPNSGTPLREALSRVGRNFAGKTDGISQGMVDPVQYSCQQNFSILTTDGYWNGNAGQTINGGAVDKQDNVDQTALPIYSSRATGTYDGNLSTDSLADVAMYYYKTDLRASGSIGALGVDVSKNNVRGSAKDFADHQHMTTFSVGLVDGLMTYQSDYETSPTGDFANIRAGTNNACAWTSGTCNWPVPAADALSAIDDLWHAAVNGRGVYYSARDPATLSEGLSGALSNIKVLNAAAAASATSSPNITPTDRSIFSSTYTTVEWAGEVVAQDIDPATGQVVPAIKWSAQAQLDARATASSDSRTIYLFDATAPGALKPFQWASMTPTQQAWFKDKCNPVSTLSQCPLLTPTQLTLANDGQNMVNFLRGQSQHEGSIYRDRAHVLGDTVNATPAFVRDPRWGFADAGYAAFKSANASRQPVLYVGANDGFLHAFKADTGQELWAYAPTPVLPNMYKLAESSYAAKHLYFVDGTPEVMDVYDGGGWRTILVAGLGAGGRAYYALDVTNPSAPKALWEFCHDASLCSVSDADLGLAYGNPVITKRASDGRWVVMVTSGYNNVAPGSGGGFLFVLDAITGAVLNKVSTGSGDTTTPSGLGRLSAWSDNFNGDPTSKYMYGANLLGGVFRFDLTSSPVGVLKLGDLTDSGGRRQPVTTRPELSTIEGYRVLFIGTGRYLGTTDLKDPATLIPPSPDAWQQTLYAFKDKDLNYGNIRSANLIQQTLTVLDSTTRSTSQNSVNWTTANGWYVDFNPGNQSPGERVNLDPQLFLGTLLVVTNVPSDDACSTGGDSWLYQFRYDTGTYVSSAQYNAAGTKLTSAVTVGAVVFRLPNGSLKTVTTDATGVKTTREVNAGGFAASGRRTSWRELVR